MIEHVLYFLTAALVVFFGCSSVWLAFFSPRHERHSACTGFTRQLANWTLLEMDTTLDKSAARPDLWTGRYLEMAELCSLEQHLARKAVGDEEALNCIPSRHNDLP